MQPAAGSLLQSKQQSVSCDGATVKHEMPPPLMSTPLNAGSGRAATQPNYPTNFMTHPRSGGASPCMQASTGLSAHCHVHYTGHSTCTGALYSAARCPEPLMESTLTYFDVLAVMVSWRAL